MNTPEQKPKSQTSSTEWDKLRFRFQSSIMVDTGLSSLAESLDLRWPIAGKDEVPSRYIDLSLAELRALPDFAGTPERVDLLVMILRDTLSFDSPFGEMVEQTLNSPANSQVFSKTLMRLGIPPAFPIRFTRLSADTKEFCAREGVTTLGEFAAVAQDLAQKVIVGGDFRGLLNAVAQLDDEGLAEYLPFRPGHYGLHLAEAIAQEIATLSPGQRLAVYRRYGGDVTGPEEAAAILCESQALTGVIEDLLKRVEDLLAWFVEDRAELVAARANGISIERYFMVLDDRIAETIAIRMALQFLDGAEVRSDETVETLQPAQKVTFSRYLRSILQWFHLTKSHPS